MQQNEFKKLIDPINSGFGEPLTLVITDTDGNTKRAEGSNHIASFGKGMVFLGDSLETLLHIVTVEKEKMTEKGLSYYKRINTDGKVYFITNRSDRTVNEWVTFSGKAQSIVLFDAMTGKTGLARWKKDNKGYYDIQIQLQPFESIIVQFCNTKKTGAFFPHTEKKGEPTEIRGEWTVHFMDGGPVIPAQTTTSQLGSWTELNGDDVKNFSGTAKYSISFIRPSGNVSLWLLDLGKVNETAEVILNGKKVATLIGPTFQCVIPSSTFQQSNKLEIIVANLMANRIAYMDRNNIPWKIFYNTNMPARRKENEKNGLFDASAWKPLPSGLSGPVTLTPVNYE
jgi:hypothetical protein